MCKICITNLLGFWKSYSQKQRQVPHWHFDTTGKINFLCLKKRVLIKITFYLMKAVNVIKYCILLENSIIVQFYTLGG
jgi:hypothetical protein